ncbi:MAG: NAD-dependent epimerase/dehydratase family protein [Clostridia bacterium]|nr:NAD-dependent epimerase/dehydratase family protein [Clostridia bacterium]
MGKVIAITGASGNMGSETIRQVLELDIVDKVKVLLVNENRERKDNRKWKRKYKDKVDIFFGDVANYDDCLKLVEGSDYVLHLAAIIPPKADHHAKETDACNRIGTENIVKAVLATNPQPKLVHISTVAIYGNRDYLHPWGRIGDPLLPSAYDEYATSKIKGERYVLESDIKTFVVLRQTGILYKNMLLANMSDGLMFHTCYNVPIEWVTAKDSGLMLKHLIEKDSSGTLKEGFWNKCYNIGGGPNQRITGFETFDRGFQIIGGSTEKFMKPDWNATRNFHCMWFEDSSELNNYLDFWRQSFEDYWVEVENAYKIFKVAKIFPPKLISALALKPLLRNSNAPKYWIKNYLDGRVIAAFGSVEKANNLPKKWEEFNVLCKGKNPDNGSPIDYDMMRNPEMIKDFGYHLDHGYDETKDDSMLDLPDMQQAAEFRGGKCISNTMIKGDLYTKLEWQCGLGHTFKSNPYTILKAGHWCPICCQPEPWKYDELAKTSKFFAQVWYDSHAENENEEYWFDENHYPQHKETK